MNTAADTEGATEIFIETLRKVDGEIESAILMNIFTYKKANVPIEVITT